MANFKAIGEPPIDLNSYDRKKFYREAKMYVWDDPHLFKIGVDNLLCRYVTREKVASILWHCQSSPYGGHFNGEEQLLEFEFY